MFSLVGMFGSKPTSIRAAYKMFIYTLIRSLPMLVGILTVHFQCGSTDWHNLNSMNLVLPDYVYPPAFIRCHCTPPVFNSSASSIAVSCLFQHKRAGIFTPIASTSCSLLSFCLVLALAGGRVQGQIKTLTAETTPTHSKSSKRRCRMTTTAASINISSCTFSSNYMYISAAILAPK